MTMLKVKIKPAPTKGRGLMTIRTACEAVGLKHAVIMGGEGTPIYGEVSEADLAALKKVEGVDNVHVSKQS